MQTRSSDENSVCPSVYLSVCLSVTCVNCDKTVERSVKIYIPYEIADFQPIFARSSSAVTPSEKSSINTNGKSTTRFPVSLRLSSYIASKTQKGRFLCKIAILNKVFYKVSLCENCRWQSCIGLTNRADFRSIYARSASAVTPV